MGWGFITDLHGLVFCEELRRLFGYYQWGFGMLFLRRIVDDPRLEPIFAKGSLARWSLCAVVLNVMGIFLNAWGGCSAEGLRAEHRRSISLHIRKQTESPSLISVVLVNHSFRNSHLMSLTEDHRLRTKHFLSYSSPVVVHQN